MANLWISVLLAVLLGACGGLSHGTGTPNTGTKPGEATARIGPTGGTLAVTSGAARGAKISIPPGALATTVQITMRAAEAPAPLPAAVHSAGPTVLFGPE